MRSWKRHFLLVFFFGFVFFAFIFTANGARTVRVGIYDNEPKVFLNEKGVASGLFPDILNYIAKQEKWKLEYVFGTWEEGLSRLERGKIDLMVDVAFSEERQKKFDFTNEAVFNSWGVVFVQKNSSIKSFQDLDGKRIAILKASVYYGEPGGIDKYIQAFGLKAEFVEVPEYEDIFNLLNNGEVDAAIASRIFALTNQEIYPNIKQTDLFFSPTELRFALTKGSSDNQYLTERLDYWVKKLKDGHGDVYKESLDRHSLSGMIINEGTIPKWVLATVFVGVIVLFLSWMFIVKLRRARKKAIQELKESEALHKALIEAAGQAGIGLVILQDTESKEAGLVSANEQACKISGYSKEEALNMTFRDFMPPNIVKQMMSKYRDRQKGKPLPYTYEASIVRKDKTKIPILISLATMNYYGKISTVAYFRDITEIKKANEALLDSEQKLKAIVYGSPIPQFVIDQNHKVVYWNKATEEITGIKAEKMIGTDNQWMAFYNKKRPGMADLLVDGDLDKISELYAGKYSKSKIVSGAYEAIDFFPKIGREGKWLYFTAALIKDLKGNIVGAVETLEDITERKKAEEGLKNHERELENNKEALINMMGDLDSEKNRLAEEKAKDEAVLKSIADGVIVVNRCGDIILMNQAAEAMLGWKAEGSLGKKWFEILHREDEKGHPLSLKKSSAIQAALTAATTTITAATTTLYYLRKDGSRFPVSRTVSPVILDGKVIGATNVFRDITQEKEIDKIKTEFVSLASHQLRTPLSAVNWYSEMLLAGDAGKLSKEQKKCLDEIYTGNQRMVRLVNALLNVSRIELGTFMVKSKPTNIMATIEGVLDEIKTQVKKKKQVLKETYDKNLPIIYVDSELLQMVIENILANAIKYTPEKGKIKIKITKIGQGEKFDSRKINKDSIGISVIDTGYGIPKYQQNKIFSKFFRADNVREKDAEGTGLGLYIVKSIMEYSGGDIWFESEENKGTTFYLTFPVKKINEKGRVRSLA